MPGLDMDVYDPREDDERLAELERRDRRDVRRWRWAIALTVLSLFALSAPLLAFLTGGD